LSNGRVGQLPFPQGTLEFPDYQVLICHNFPVQSITARYLRPRKTQHRRKTLLLMIPTTSVAPG
jgi:hypothetical protein